MEQPRRDRWKAKALALLLVLMLFSLMSAVVGGAVGYALASRGSEPAAPAVARQAMAEPESMPVLPETTIRPDDAPVGDPDSPADVAPATTTPPEIEAAPPAAPGVPTDGSIVSAVERARPAVVRVVTRGGSGSGFFVSADGYLVTNEHVVAGATEVLVDLSLGERYPAAIVGTSPEFDLAVLKVSEPVPAHLLWGDSSALPLGGQVIAIGSALGQYQNSVTVGILSGYNRQLGNQQGLLQTDAAINQGNSGGPLVNLQGEVIGINTLVVRGGGSTAEGLGFAIPSNIARSIAQQLIDNGVAVRPLLGVNYRALNSQSAAELGAPVEQGALIEQVVPGSAAERAGLRSGDIVAAIDGRPVDERDNLQMHVLSHQPGEQITLEVLRDGQSLELALELGTPT